ncbi:hypothetical protein LBMAG46_42310 [Planctomycetia bacterium]|nr:hypothetical protein LBMAG46_42310 [Planctomycetia bacterium]
MAAIDKACPFCMTDVQQAESFGKCSRVGYHCGTTAYLWPGFKADSDQSDKCRITCMERKLQDIREAAKAARRFEAEPEEDSIRYEEHELGSLTDATILDRIEEILRG